MKTIRVSKKIAAVSASVVLSVCASQAQEIGTWAGFRTAAVSFTFDDGAPSHVTDAAPLFEKYGYRATFNLVTKWSPDWTGFQNMAKKGHEIASHSDNHGDPMPDGECSSSKSTIEGNITQEYGLVTLAYPNCKSPSASSVSGNYVVGRICNGSWASVSDIVSKDGPSDWTKVPAQMTGSTVINTSEAYKTQMNSAIQSGGWVSFLTHGFEGKSNNGYATYSATDIGEMEKALQWAQQNDSKIWVAPMGHVAMYIKERNASKITAGASSATSMSFTLTHSIASTLSKFNYPLSIRVKNTNGWTTVGGTQGGKAIDASIKDGYIYFDAVPNGGDIVLSSDGSAVVTPASSASGTTPVTPASSAAAAQGQPFKGAIAVPGTIEAENYDVNAYSHTKTGNDATGYRTDDAGIVTGGTGTAVGYTSAGDYYEYSINVAAAGTYKVTVSGATGNTADGSVTISVGSSSVKSAINAKGDWQTYSDVAAGEITLAAGQQTLRLTIDNDNLNVDWIKLEGDGTTAIPASSASSVIPVATSSAAAGTVSPASSAADGNVPQVVAQNIFLNVGVGMVQCQIFDMNGHLVKSTNATAGSVNELWNNVNGGLNRGAYIMRYGQVGRSNMQTVRVRK